MDTQIIPTIQTTKMPPTPYLTPDQIIANQRRAKREWYLANRESVLEKNKARSKMYSRRNKINKIVENEELISEIIARLRLDDENAEICDCHICSRGKITSNNSSNTSNNNTREEEKENHPEHEEKQQE